jgi:DHA1 family bicyclomycin/chloramphenicol resistance-like MFS transporter
MPLPMVALSPPATAHLLRPGSSAWIATLAALLAVTALSIDMSLPAQPAMARALGVGPAATQLTLSLFLLGYAAGQLLAGALSDSWGRRPVLLVGLCLYAAAGLACSQATSMAWLVALRLAQGLSAAAAPVVARAMVRDTQPPAEAARQLSVMVSLFALAPMVAPWIGASLLDALGWRWIFGALGLVGLILAAVSALGLPETLPPERRSRFTPAAVPRSLLLFLRTPGTLQPTLLSCASFAGQFAYISASPFILMEGHGVSAGRYGFYFALTSLALMAGSIAGGRLLRRLAPRRVLRLGGAVLCAGALLVGLGTLVPGPGLFGLVAPMMAFFFGIGLTAPSATALAMEPVPQIAGAASASVGLLSMASGAAAGSVAARFAGRDPRVLGALLAASGVVSLLLALSASRARQAQA